MHILSQGTDNCPLESAEGNEHRKYSVINLHGKMLLDSAGIKPATPDNQSEAHPTEPRRTIPHELSNLNFPEKYWKMSSAAIEISNYCFSDEQLLL